MFQQPQSHLCKQLVMSSWMKYFTSSKKFSRKIVKKVTLFRHESIRNWHFNCFIAIATSKLPFSAYKVSMFDKPRTVTTLLLTEFGLENLSCVTRKPAFCICENKDADQLHGSRAADQHLCFSYIDSTIPLLSRSKISSL